MSKTTNGECSKLVSNKNKKQKSIKVLSRAEIDEQLANINSENNSLAHPTPQYREFATCYYCLPEEICDPEPEEICDPEPEELRALMQRVDHIGYAKLECALCHKVYPNEPADYPVNGEVAKGEDLVSKFRTVGLDAELQYYCPHCADSINLQALWHLDLSDSDICKVGIFLLVLKEKGAVLSYTIPQYIYENKVSNLTSDVEYQIALKFLENPKYTYEDFVQWCLTWDKRETGVLSKLKIDCALQKVLGFINSDYDVYGDLVKNILKYKQGDDD